MLSPSDRVGSWQIDDLVSMGVPRTYRARHDTGTEALIEVMPLSKATMEGQKREVDALQRLKHPSLPDVVDFGVDHERDLVWTAFRWFAGEPLEDRMLRGVMRWERACAVLRDLAHALAYVHASGFVHRDLRPANVIVAPNRAWLVGFDFALTQAQLEAMSQAPFGDLAYLAPEVLGDPTHHGPRADVYAYGCLAYELLTGKAAFPAAAWGERADQATRMLEWKTRTAPLDPGTSVPEWLRSLVQKCTEPVADRRLPDLDALVGWLDAARGSWEHHSADRSEEPEIDDGPEFEPTGEVPIPIGVGRPSLSGDAMPPPLRPAAPTLVPVAPSLRAAPAPVTPATLPRSQPAPYTPVAMPPPAAPAIVQYFFAAGLGCVTALGFCSVVILFGGLSNGSL